MAKNKCAVCGEEISGFGYRGLKKANTVILAMTSQEGLSADAPDFEERMAVRNDETDDWANELIRQGWEVVEVGRGCMTGE